MFWTLGFDSSYDSVLDYRVMCSDNCEPRKCRMFPTVHITSRLTTGLRKAHPQVEEYERTQELPNVEDVKAASNLSDFRSIAAVVVLRVSATLNFRDCASFWVTRLMNTGPCIFLEKPTGNYFLSFGVQGDAGMSWAVEPLGADDSYFCLASRPSETSSREAATRIQFFCTSALWFPNTEEGDNEEQYEGIPTEVCFLPLKYVDQ